MNSKLDKLQIIAVIFLITGSFIALSQWSGDTFGLIIMTLKGIGFQLIAIFLIILSLAHKSTNSND